MSTNKSILAYRSAFTDAEWEAELARMPATQRAQYEKALREAQSEQTVDLDRPADLDPLARDLLDNLTAKLRRETAEEFGPMAALAAAQLRVIGLRDDAERQEGGS